MEPAWTIKKLLDWTQSAFLNKGISSAALDAQLLLGQVLKLDRLQLFMQHERPASDEERQVFRRLVKRRLAGECVAYILGQREFYSREFVVGPGVLVPRSETELLVEKALTSLARIQEQKTADKPLLWADLGAGSGCIGLTIACEATTTKGDLYENSAAALHWCRSNMERLQAELGGRVSLIDQDVLDFVPSQKYDLVVSNPPYLTAAEMGSASPEVQLEPSAALHGGGDDGADWYRTFIPQLPQWLEGGGCFLCEIGIQQGPLVVRLLEQQGLHDIVVYKDYSGYERIVTAWMDA